METPISAALHFPRDPAQGCPCAEPTLCTGDDMEGGAPEAAALALEETHL